MTAPSLRQRFDTAEPFETRADIRPSITLEAGDLHNIATHAERALIIAGAPFYVRGGTIVRPVVDRLPSASGALVRVARLLPVQESAMVDHLSRAATWQKFDGRKQGLVRADPPAAIASTILSRDGEWKFERLSGVITTPTMRPDGTILMEPGYDKATHLLLIEPPRLPGIPAEPSRQDALVALALLDALLEDFPFTDDASRSVALSALITPVVRGAMPVAPMHAVTATAPGSGKSYIIDLVSAISAGERAPVLTAGRTEEETEKRLGAAIIEGQPLISIDNVNGELGGDALCQMIERPIVSVRPLGTSRLMKVESRACCFATGNNIQLVGDMTRRVVLCSLDPDMERPELRKFHGDPFAAVVAERGTYIAAALVIVRAYAAAGYPELLTPLASFEAWSRLVRSALVWLGRSDPIETMEKARSEDPVTSALNNLFAVWHHAVGPAPHTTAQLITAAEAMNSMGNAVAADLRLALNEIAQDRNGKLSGMRLGLYLTRYGGRIVGGLRHDDGPCHSDGREDRAEAAHQRGLLPRGGRALRRRHRATSQLPTRWTQGIGPSPPRMRPRVFHLLHGVCDRARAPGVVAQRTRVSRSSRRRRDAPARGCFVPRTGGESMTMAHAFQPRVPIQRPPSSWPRRHRRRWLRANDFSAVDALMSAIPSLPRPVLARLTEQIIDRMDEIDGDPDVELSGDELDGTGGEDDFIDRYGANMGGGWSGPGCPISDPDSCLCREDIGANNAAREKMGFDCTIGDDDPGEGGDLEPRDPAKRPTYGVDQSRGPISPFQAAHS